MANQPTDNIREKFLEKFPEPTNHIYAHQQAELYEQWHDRWRVYQAAYAQAISEFEQVFIIGTGWQKPEHLPNGTPLYTRKD